MIMLIALENKFFKKTFQKIKEKYKKRTENNEKIGRNKWKKKCPKCGKTMHKNVLEQHLKYHDQENKKTSEKPRKDIKKQNRKSVKAQYVDNYEIQKQDKEKKETKHVKKEKNKNDHTLQKFKTRWSEILNYLEMSGLYVFDRNSHVGSVRGNDIIREFRKDLRRVEQKTDFVLKIKDLDFKFETGNIGYIKLKEVEK